MPMTYKTVSPEILALEVPAVERVLDAPDPIQTKKTLAGMMATKVARR